MSRDVDQPGPVRVSETLDAARLDAWLKRQLPTLAGTPMIRQFDGGASNLTYQLDYGHRVLILRRPPFGHVTKSAHDMRREFGVLQRLRPVYPWVPRVLALCTDHEVLGCDFYVMEKVAGIIPRRDLPVDLALGVEQLGKLCRSVLDRLIALHRLDYRKAGLADLGRGEGYVGRQIAGWSRRYRAARTEDVPDFEPVMAWLAARQPADVATCLIHNDFRFDNLVLDPEEPTEVIAVLDWEMATLGDPLMDLGILLAYWVQADDGPAVLKTRKQPTHLPGMFTRDEVLNYYLARTGLVIDSFDFYRVYGLFRTAAILQQIYARFRRGETDNPRFASLDGRVRALASRCHFLIGA